MRTAILDPFSGIAGDMTLGALLGVGLDPAWLRSLPARLGLAEVGVDIREVLRGELVCWKVDFDIPPQPHGRHITEIRELVARSGAPAPVRNARQDVAGELRHEPEMGERRARERRPAAVPPLAPVVGPVARTGQVDLRDRRQPAEAGQRGPRGPGRAPRDDDRDG